MTITRNTQLSLLQWLSPPPAPPPFQPTLFKPQSANNIQTDSVQISNFVKAALQEATESPEQTANEARNGDPQAQRLLAREAAEAKAIEGQTYASESGPYGMLPEFMPAKRSKL